MAAENASALHHLPPDTILHGKYLLSGAIGEGGFGITYTGQDLALDMKVAVKEYYPTGFVTREATATNTVQPFAGTQGEFFCKGRERFMREARTLAKFASLPGIVSARDFFEENGTAYLVMEFIDGQTFKAYLEKMGGRLSPQQVFEMMRPVMLALRQVHAAGVIHRDVSPDNIMISNDGYMKLLDFGSAQDYAEERSRTVMVKQGFAPYEQYQTRGSQGPWTDVYALCATMYRAITGMTPPESTERMYQDTLRPPSAFGIALQPGQEEALMRGLALRAEERTQDVDPLLAALAPVYATAPPDIKPEQEPAPKPEPKPKKEKKPFVWPLSKKLTAILAGALVVVIAVCVGVPMIINNRDSNPGQAVNAPTKAAQGESQTTTEAPAAAEPAIVMQSLNYEKGDTVQFGPYTWRVLDVQDGRALLITKDIVEERPYNDELTNVTWETCTLRKWLNGEFYTRFSTEEKARIAETVNVNLDNQWFGTQGGNSTTDKIFLLSLGEVVKYFGDSGDLQANKRWSWDSSRTYYEDADGSILYDQYNADRKAKGGGWWWLRSPGLSSRYAVAVESGGRIYIGGKSVDKDSIFGVRPALWLRLTQAEDFTTTQPTATEETTAQIETPGIQNVPEKYVGSSKSGPLGWDDYQEAYAIAAALVNKYQGMDRASQVKGVAYELYHYGVQRTGYLQGAYPKHYADPYGFFVVRVASSAGAARAAGLCFDILGIPWEHFQKDSADGEQGAVVQVENEEWLVWSFREPQPYLISASGYSLIY